MDGWARARMLAAHGPRRGPRSNRPSRTHTRCTYSCIRPPTPSYVIVHSHTHTRAAQAGGIERRERRHPTCFYPANGRPGKMPRRILLGLCYMAKHRSNDAGPQRGPRPDASPTAGCAVGTTVARGAARTHAGRPVSAVCGAVQAQRAERSGGRLAEWPAGRLMGKNASFPPAVLVFMPGGGVQRLVG